MTREEAIKSIQDFTGWFKKDKPIYKALNMAIKALEQEPTDRIEYGTDGNAYKLWMSNGKEFEQEPCDDNRLYIKVYADLEPQEKAEKLYQICEEDELKEVYKVLGEYCEIEPYDDVVSREDAIKHLTKARMIGDNRPMTEIFAELPSVRPQEPMREFTEEEAKSYSKALDKMYKPTGFNVFEVVNTPWIFLDNCANSGYYCSKCKKKLVKDGWSETVKKINFCPNCGACMKDGRTLDEFIKESEDKE